MLSRKNYKKRRDNIFLVLLFSAAWFMVNVFIAQYISIENPRWQEVMGFSVLCSISLIIISTLALMTISVAKAIGGRMNHYQPPSRKRVR